MSYATMTDEEKALQRKRSAEWKKRNRDKVNANARQARADKKAGLPTRQRGLRKGYQPVKKATPVAREKTSGELAHAKEQATWRLVHQVSDGDYVLKVWIRGMVIKYERINPQRIYYCHALDTTGKKYVSAAWAESAIKRIERS